MPKNAGNLAGVGQDYPDRYEIVLIDGKMDTALGGEIQGTVAPMAGFLEQSRSRTTDRNYYRSSRKSHYDKWYGSELSQEYRQGRPPRRPERSPSRLSHRVPQVENTTGEPSYGRGSSRKTESWRFKERSTNRARSSYQLESDCLSSGRYGAEYPDLEKRKPSSNDDGIPSSMSEWNNVCEGPGIPDPPCSPNNPDVWPEDYCPGDRYPIGTVRQKVFPGCNCKECGLPHPTGLHFQATSLYEAFRYKGSAGGRCNNCSRYGHLAHECGFGEWRDLPDNLPLPACYTAYERPWPKEVNIVPFPRVYYGLGKCAGDDLGFPDLPAEFAAGLPSGLLDIRKGLRFALESLVSTKRGTERPKFDNRIHEPYRPPGFPPPKTEGRSGRQRHTAARAGASFQEQKSQDWRHIENRALGEQVDSLQEKPEMDDGYGGCVHDEQLKNPRCYKNQATWIDAEFLRQIRKSVLKSDWEVVLGLYDEFQDYAKRPGPAHRPTMIKLRDEAMEVLAPYVAHLYLVDNDWVLSSDVRNMVEDRAAKRAEERRAEQLAAWVRARPNQMQNRALPPADKLQDDGIQPLMRNSKEVSLHDLTQAEITNYGREHPLLMPTTELEMQSQIKSWRVFSQKNISQPKVAAWVEWFRNEWQALIEDTEIIHTLNGQSLNRPGKSKREDVVWEVDQIRKELDTLGNNFVRRVIKLGTKITKEVEHYKGSDYGVMEFITLEKTLAAIFVEFDQSICTDLDATFGLNPVSLEALRNSHVIGAEENYHQARGALLPRNSPKKPVLARLVWHADFQRYWEAKSNKDRI